MSTTAAESCLIKQLNSATTHDEIDSIEAELLALRNATQATGEQKAILSRLTQQAAAWLIGKTTRFLRDHQPARNADGTYDGPALLEWTIARERADAVERAAADGGAESAKARILEAKAIQGELDAQRELGRLVDREKVHEFLAQLSGVLRSAGDKLQREFGREALEILNDAIETTGKLIEESS